MASQNSSDPANPVARLKLAAERTDVLTDLQGDKIEHVTTVKIGLKHHVMLTMAGFAAEEIPRDRLGNLIAALEQIDPADGLAQQLRAEKNKIDRAENEFAKLMQAADKADASLPLDTRSQAEKFAQAARDLGADQDEEAFKGVLRRLGKSKT